MILSTDDYHSHFPRDRTVLKLAGPSSNTPPILYPISQPIPILTLHIAWASFLGSGVLTIAISVDLWARVTDLRLTPVLADMTPSTKAAHAMIAVRESLLPPSTFYLLPIPPTPNAGVRI